MTISTLSKEQFTDLMDKATMHPNRLTEGEMREVASRLPEYLYSMPKDWKQKWFESFANHTFLGFLSKSETIAFGELCRQAYKHKALYRILGHAALDNSQLAAIQVVIEAEIQDSLQSSFLARLFGKKRAAKIFLDQTRFTPSVSNENRLKLNNAIADALLDVICKSENHPCSGDIKTFPELTQIRNDAKLAIIRALEVSLGTDEIFFPIAKSCCHNEEQEKQKLLERIETISKERELFFEKAKKKGITIPTTLNQESAKQLAGAKNVIEKAKSNGINITFAYDMVALNLADEKTYEAYLLANEFINHMIELSWMKVFLGFGAGTDEKQVVTKELEKAFKIYSKRLTLETLVELNEHMNHLREVTITPMSLRQVFQESSKELADDVRTSFQNRLNSLQSPRDPDDVIQFLKLKEELYEEIRVLEKSPIRAKFIELCSKQS
ncbi:MAG: hypothetical protein JSR46_02740 [Verrucomicrobia bacterium]|nr:hypothetical protein [Verrucomicrobiota bacterium]